jgi:membrane peptidoglycan carboxypeptidase
MFRHVVESGTGQLARVRGVDVAGKTGTARKYVDGRYVPGSYCASFVGYFPASDPAAVCLVMLDLPGTPTYSGGLVSAPIFKGIAEKIAATSARFVPRTQGEGALVSRQRQAPDMKQARGTSALLASENIPQGVPAGYAIVPDVTGFPIRRAVNSLVVRQLDAAITGTGIVVAQSPRVGERVKCGSRVTLRCEARNLQQLTLY